MKRHNKGKNPPDGKSIGNEGQIIVTKPQFSERTKSLIGMMMFSSILESFTDGGYMESLDNNDEDNVFNVYEEDDTDELDELNDKENDSDDATEESEDDNTISGETETV